MSNNKTFRTALRVLFTFVLVFGLSAPAFPAIAEQNGVAPSAEQTPPAANAQASDSGTSSGGTTGADSTQESTAQGASADTDQAAENEVQPSAAEPNATPSDNETLIQLESADDDPAPSPAANGTVTLNGQAEDSLQAAFNDLSSVSGDATIEISGSVTIDDVLSNSTPSVVTMDTLLTVPQGKTVTLRSADGNQAVIQVNHPGSIDRNQKRANSLITVQDGATLNVDNVDFQGPGNVSGTQSDNSLRAITAFNAQSVVLHDTTVENFWKYAASNIYDVRWNGSSFSGSYTPANVAGAGLFAYGTQDVQITGSSRFIGDVALIGGGNQMQGGGAIFVQNSNLRVTDSTVINKCSARRGIEDTLATATDLSNYSVDSGNNDRIGRGSAIEAVSNQNNNVTIDGNTIISDNTAYSGSTIEADYYITLHITGQAQIINNRNCWERGAAVFSDVGGDDTTNSLRDDTTFIIDGNACISGNSFNAVGPNAIYDRTSASAVAMRITDGTQGRDRLTISENARINNNRMYQHDNDGNAPAVNGYLRCDTTVSGNAQIRDNTAPSASGCAGVMVRSDSEANLSTITLQDAPTIVGNVSGSTENNVLLGFINYFSPARTGNPNLSQLHVSQMYGGNVGVTVSTNNRGQWRNSNGSITSSLDDLVIGTAEGGDANAINNDHALSYIHSDTSDLVATAVQNPSGDQRSYVIWGNTGSPSNPDMPNDIYKCQILRPNGGSLQFISFYRTLDEAADAAQNGDVIEVFRSHTTANTVWLNKNITVRRAPVGTNPVSQAAPAESDDITVTRNTHLNASMVVVSDSVTHHDDGTVTHTPVDVNIQNLTFDGSGTDMNHNGIDVASRMHLSNVNVRNFTSSVDKNGQPTSAVWVWDGTEKDDCAQDDVCSINQMMGEGVIYLSNTVNVVTNNGNKDVALPNTSHEGGIMRAEGTVNSNSSIGVTMQDSNDVRVYRPLVQSTGEEGAPNASAMNGLGSLCFDDTQTLPVAAGDPTAPADNPAGGQKSALNGVVHFADTPQRVEKTMTGLFADKTQSFNISSTLSDLNDHHSSNSNITVTFYDKDGNVIAGTDLGKRSSSVSGSDASTLVSLTMLPDKSYAVINGMGPSTGFNVSETMGRGQSYTMTATIDGSDATVSDNAFSGATKNSTQAVAGTTDTNVVVNNADNQQPGTGIANAMRSGSNGLLAVIAIIAAAGAAGLAYARTHRKHGAHEA